MLTTAITALAISAAGQCGGYTQTAKNDTCSSTCSKPTQHVQAASYNDRADIVDIAASNDAFSTLVAAVKAAGLVETLQGDGPFTVFAPTNDAFAALPAGTVESLLRPENRAQLVDILTYHVVPGRVLAADVVKLDRATTVNGQRVDIESDRSGVRIDGASVINTDIKASNGVIHVIDRVILPETNTIVDTARSAGSFETLLAAATAAGLAETLAGEGPFTVFAPTDEAFAALGAETIQSLLKPSNRGKLRSILKYHVVPGRVYADQAVKLDSAATLQGGSIEITSNRETVKINDAKVINADIETANGVIHVIDGVLVPETR